MSSGSHFERFLRKIDWRIWFGLVVTFFWITGGIWFVFDSFDANPDQVLTLATIGNFLEGAEEMDHYFKNAANGDHEIFARQLLTMDYLKEGGLPELLYCTEIRRKHCRNFRRTFDRLLNFAEGCDIDGIIVDAMRQTAFGLLYDRMERHLPGDLVSGED